MNRRSPAYSAAHHTRFPEDSRSATIQSIVNGWFAYLSSASAAGSRTTALAPLHLLFTLVISALLISLMVSTPYLVLLASFCGLPLLLELGASVYLFLKRAMNGCKNTLLAVVNETTNHLVPPSREFVDWAVAPGRGRTARPLGAAPGTRLGCVERASLRPARRLRSLAGRSTGDRRAGAGALKRGRHHARARVQAAPER